MLRISRSTFTPQAIQPVLLSDGAHSVLQQGLWLQTQPTLVSWQCSTNEVAATILRRWVSHCKWKPLLSVARSPLRLRRSLLGSARFCRRSRETQIFSRSCNLRSVSREQCSKLLDHWASDHRNSHLLRYQLKRSSFSDILIGLCEQIIALKRNKE